MTLPYERTRSVINAREFLTKIMLPPCMGGFARIPKAVRKEANRALRHFPHAFDLTREGAFDTAEVERYYADKEAQETAAQTVK